MELLIALAQILAELPQGAWGGFVVLSSFALAAFAIYAMLTVSKGRR